MKYAQHRQASKINGMRCAEMMCKMSWLSGHRWVSNAIIIGYVLVVSLNVWTAVSLTRQPPASVFSSTFDAGTIK